MPDNGKPLADLPPSAKLVYYLLAEEAPLTQRAISDESLLPQRTVRYAITRLEDINAITEQVNLSDPRQSLYETAIDCGPCRSGKTPADD